MQARGVRAGKEETHRFLNCERLKSAAARLLLRVSLSPPRACSHGSTPLLLSHAQHTPSPRRDRSPLAERDAASHTYARSSFLVHKWASSTGPARSSSATCSPRRTGTPGGRPTCAAWTRRGGTCEFVGGESGGCAVARPSTSTSLSFLISPSHSKDQWAAPTKGAGSWTSETANARFEARHDAALKALRRPRIDDE